MAFCDSLEQRDMTVFHVSDGTWEELSALAQVDAFLLQQIIQKKKLFLISKIKIFQLNIIY